MRLEYLKTVLEGIRAAASHSMHGIGRGGVEVGGILLGTRLDNLLRIVDWKPIACSHAMGPSFSLTTEEREGLGEQIRSLAPDIAERNLQILGWYVSHTRSDFQPTTDELEIHEQFFPMPWQVLFVVVPTRYGDAEATIHASPDLAGGVLEPRQPVLAVSPLPIAAKSARDASTGDAAEHWDDRGVVLSSGQQTGSRNLLWLAALVALLVLSAGTAVYLSTAGSTQAEPILSLADSTPFEAISLHGRDGARRFVVSWNAQAEAVNTADRASLEVIDGEISQARQLSKQELAAGQFSFVRRSPIVLITMTTFRGEQQLGREKTRFRYTALR